MLRIFFILFITLPLLELYVLIQVGSDIGGLNTIVLCLLTAIIGGMLIRWQGLITLMDAQKCMAAGDLPAEHAFHGILLALAGVLLFTPGFITDSVGFLLLFPPLRRWLIHRFFPAGSIQTGIQTGQKRSDIIDVEIVDPGKSDSHLT
jgi:UPF0716 protein FxsA